MAEHNIGRLCEDNTFEETRDPSWDDIYRRLPTATTNSDTGSLTLSLNIQTPPSQEIVDENLPTENAKKVIISRRSNNICTHEFICTENANRECQKGNNI